MSPDDPRHGTYAGAAAHWKVKDTLCGPCRAAATKKRKLNRYLQLSGAPATVPSLGTVRRIQALQAIGYSQPDIAAESGVDLDTLRNPLLRGTTVYSTTAARIAAAYERLCETPAPPSRNASYARTTARRSGWPPPGAWLDIDDPSEVPDPGWKPYGSGRTARRKTELIEEFDWLVQNGESREMAAERLGVTLDAVRDARSRIARESRSGDGAAA